jgi:hypothetical protein
MQIKFLLLLISLLSFWLLAWWFARSRNAADGVSWSDSGFHEGTFRRVALCGVFGVAVGQVLEPATMLPAGAAGVLFGLWISLKKTHYAVKSGASDVLQDASKINGLAAPFDPAPYIKSARKSGRDEVFLGLDQSRRPILFPRTKLDKNHVEILGESGAGKSSLAGVLLTQLAEWAKMLIRLANKYYVASGNYNAADRRFSEVIRPNLDRYALDDCIDLIEGIQSNGQTYGRGRAGDDHGALHERVLELDPKFDFSDYKTFVRYLDD